MKILKSIVILIIVAALLFVLGRKAPVSAPVVDNKDTTGQPIELCFAKYGTPNERGLADVYTLRMMLSGENAMGELKFLPAEKDSLTGVFEGTVSAVDKEMMARTAHLMWATEGEGMKTTQELSIIFGEGTAHIGFGEMVDRGDGVYIYKDPASISYTLDLNDVACSDVSERENVAKYLRDNISTLSPVKAVAGGTWYVTSYVIDVQKDSGTVSYEDGHIQEKKNFTYTADSAGMVSNMKLQ